MSRFRLFSFSLPSLVAACLACLTAGLAEASVATYGLFQGLAAAGFVCAVALAPAFLASLIGRGLWHAWRPHELAVEVTREGGGAPALAAWFTYVVVALIFLGLMTMHGVRLLLVRSNANIVAVLGAPVLVCASAALLLALSRPSVRWGAALLTRIDDRTVARRGRSRMTPRAIVVSTAVAVAVACGLIWTVTFRPQIGHLELGYLAYAALGAVVLVAVPALWPRLERARLVAGGTSVAVVAMTLLVLGSAFYVRASRPYSMLEIWGGSRLAGSAIDLYFDVQSLRSEIEIEGLEPPAIAGAEHPSVVLITIDTMRADRTPIYGGDAKMPALAGLARRGVTFERAYSPGNVTRRSLPTIATGLSPHRVHGRVAGWALRMDPRHVMLAERFRAAGYDTAGFFCCFSHFGPKHRLGLIRGIDHLEIEFDGDALSKSAARWLERRKGTKRPLFVWFHFIEPHEWEKDYPAGKKAPGRRERYDMSLEETDLYLGRVVGAARAALGDDALIAVTSDHGEGLGDHKIRNHAGSLYDMEVRVPLVIAGVPKPGRRLRTTVGLVDLAPTLLELAGFTPPSMPAMDGLSFAGLVRGDRPDELGQGEAYANMVADRSVEVAKSAVMSGRYKLILRDHDGEAELYDTVADPDELNDIKGDLPEVLASMMARLERRRRIDRVSPF